MINSLTYNGKNYNASSVGDNILMSVSAFIGDSLVAAELPVDTLTAVVRNRTVPALIAADNMLAAAGGVLLAAETADITLDKIGHYGDPVKYFRKDEQFAKFYLESIKRTGKYEYTLNCLSAIGMLLTSDHYGGLYNGETAAEIMEDIVGGIISYTLADELASVPIYGLLPKAKRRDNLRDLLFAIGGQIRKDTLGELNIVPMTTGEPYEITADEFYMGGSVTGGNPATQINVTEHSFMKLANDEVVTLYDGESAAEELVTPKGATVTGVLVDFSEPVYDLTIQNAEILENGVNYAVITGSPAAILTGKKYTHTERIINRRNNKGGTPNVLTSKACTLINLMNSELVADRLMAYYGSAKTVEADIVVTTQRPGDAVTFEDPFGDLTTGYIVDMELTASAILKAKTTLVSGFIPTASGNYYSNLAVVSESGTFTVPEDCKGKIRVVLIGGGSGGEAGQAGEAGEAGPTYTTIYDAASAKKYQGDPGNGGAGGKGGKAGKAYVATIPAKPGDTFSVVIGAGGEGASFGEEPGDGAATTFGDLSSDNGYRVGSGYAALMGEIYALPGNDGAEGGRGQEPGASASAGGERPTITYEGETWLAGESGSYSINSDGTETTLASGGLGGGAAVGVNGNNGGNGTAGTTSALGGNGGAGATPVAAPDGTVPGSGGGGGHGGGGGGGGGCAIADTPYGGKGGAGGHGGKGGNGASGLALIYY